MPAVHCTSLTLRALDLRHYLKSAAATLACAPPLPPLPLYSIYCGSGGSEVERGERRERKERKAAEGAEPAAHNHQQPLKKVSVAFVHGRKSEEKFFIRCEGGDLFIQHPCSSVGLDVCLLEECTLEVPMQSLVFTRDSPSMS